MTMIHIGEQTLEQVLTDHQRVSRTQCLCGVELEGGLVAHLVGVIKDAEQE